MPLAEILTAIEKTFNKYMVLPHEHCAPAIALWVAHTYQSTNVYISPRLVFASAVPGSGKTRGLELCELLCFNARLTVSTSTAALFRRIGSAHRNNQLPPTILFDETDALFSGSRPSETTEQLRGLMNAGYKRGATVDRCEGDSVNMQVVEWPVFSPLALAGLTGHLPDTIKTRAIIIEMRKRTNSEKVSSYRSRDVENEVQPIVGALKAWASNPDNSLAGRYPTMPKGVEDRAAEVWETLLAIADQAGDEWATKAREACKAFVFATTTDTPPISIELLDDIRTVMGHGEDTSFTKRDAIKTEDLRNLLFDLEGSPWGEYSGDKGITARQLAQLLRPYEIRPVAFRNGLETGKGYIIARNEKQAGLFDAWSRYLKPVSPSASGESVTTVTTVTPQVDMPETVTEAVTASVTVTETDTQRVTNNNAVTSTVTDVTDVTDSAGHVPAESLLQHPETTLEPASSNDFTITQEQRDKVLDFLQEDYGLSPHVIAGSLQLTEEHVQAILQDLETRNLAYSKKGKYQKVVKAA